MWAMLLFPIWLGWSQSVPKTRWELRKAEQRSDQILFSADAGYRSTPYDAQSSYETDKCFAGLMGHVDLEIRRSYGRVTLHT